VDGGYPPSIPHTLRNFLAFSRNHPYLPASATGGSSVVPVLA